jgi:hypothetical protein
LGFTEPIADPADQIEDLPEEAFGCVISLLF